MACTRPIMINLFMTLRQKTVENLKKEKPEMENSVGEKKAVKNAIRKKTVDNGGKH